MAAGQGRGSMSLSMKFIRLLIILFNLAFILVGLALLVIGVYVVKDPKMQQLRPLLNPDLTTQYSQSLSYIEIFAIVLIIIGGALFSIGFLGCCGAIKGFRFLHVLYAVVIGIIILVEIGLIVFYVAYQNQFKNELVGKLENSINTYYVGTPINNSSTTNPISLSWDFIQFNLQCCGAVGPSDYQNASHWNNSNPYQPGTNLTVPLTCCPVSALKNWNTLPSNLSDASACAQSGQNAYTQGCYNQLVNLVATYKNNIAIGGAIVGLVEVLALCFALLLYCRKPDYSSL
jgi:hypothetical protein